MKSQLSRIANATCLVTLATIAGCGGGSSSTTSSSGSGTSSGSSSSSSSSSGGSCSYADKITASERSTANSCGIQVSGAYAQADNGLASVIAACQQGQKATADAYYASTYTQMVAYARSNSSALSCGGSNGPTLPNTSAATYYNFCVEQKTSGGRISYTGVCSGPYKQNEGGCPSGYSNNVGQYSSMSSCTTAGQNWLNTH
jgi:hypothetical protein